MSHVFISYSHDDSDYVKQLAQHIEAQQFTVWYDAHLQVGQNWQDELGIAIQTSSAVIVVMSESGTDSEWIQREVTLARKMNIPLVPLLLSGAGFDNLKDKQYFKLNVSSLPTDDFFKRLRQLARPNSTYFIDKLITALEEEKDFEEQALSDQVSSFAPAYIGVRKRSITFDLNAIHLIRADHLSPGEMKDVYDDFVYYMTQWKPSFFMERMIKKCGIVCFVFENPTSQEIVQHVIRLLTYDSEQTGLQLIDGVRVVSWALNLDLYRLEAQSVALDILPPAVADYYPGKKWLQNFIPKHMQEYAQSRKIFALTI